MVVLNAYDAVITAMNLEASGQKIYEKAAKMVSHPTIRHSLMHFADSAVRHQMIFKAMSIRMRLRNIPNDHFEKKLLNYLEALLDSHALYCDDQSEEVSLDDLDVLELVLLASQSAKDMILYLSEMMDVLPASEIPLVKECFDAQREQLQQLRRILSILKKRQDTVRNQETYHPMQAAI